MADENVSAPSPAVAVVYKDAIDNLMFMKKQQWMVTNYLVAIFAGIFAFNRTVGNLEPSERTILVVLVTVALCYGIYLLAAIQAGMAKFRRRITWISNRYFTDEEKCALELPITPKPALHNWSFLFGMMGVATIAWGLVFYSLVRH